MADDNRGKQQILGTAGPSPAAPPATNEYPPYPPSVPQAPPMSVAETISAGHDIRYQFKSSVPKRVHPLPQPARPRNPKATDVKLSKRAAIAHARCLRRNKVAETARLQYISKPLNRSILYFWREKADYLPAETIGRLRNMLDADEPFKPEQAYEYFANLKRTRKKPSATLVKDMKRDVLSLYGDKRFLWARNATIAFAKGIQRRLAKGGCYSLADRMLRLSDIILNDMCMYMHLRTPSRTSNHPKSKFLMEMSDKIAVWFDEILQESNDRMLMMDYDEDEDVLYRPPGGFKDDFLNMMNDDLYTVVFRTKENIENYHLRQLETVLENNYIYKPESTALT